MAALVTGCAGTPTSPTIEQPVQQKLSSYQALAFLDLDGNGRRDMDETLRVPGVTVSIGDQQGQTEARTGRLTLTSVPEGGQERSVVSTPPFYEAEVPVAQVTVPQSAPEQLAMRLPIGNNIPATYMAFGDSITDGDGSADGTGYRGPLEKLLAQHFGSAQVLNEGIGGTKTPRGVERIAGALQSDMPAYTIILYGTNDWHNLDCQRYQDCPVVENLRSMIQAAKAVHSLPVIGTIIPANPGLQPPARNEWVARTDDDIRAMAQEEGAVVADLQAAFVFFMNLTDLFSDHVHPNDIGYQLIAQQFFLAISGRAQATPVLPVPWAEWAPPGGEPPFSSRP
jgi:lysophospholipase L1-like esterase